MHVIVQFQIGYWWSPSHLSIELPHSSMRRLEPHVTETAGGCRRKQCRGWRYGVTWVNLPLCFKVCISWLHMSYAEILHLSAFLHKVFGVLPFIGYSTCES